MNICLNCKYWQCANRLRDRTSYSDCYRVIASLQPKLFLCYNQIDEDTREYFKIPWDPHDLKYWIYNERFMKWYNKIIWNDIRVRRVIVVEEDMKYDQHGAERLARVGLHYFQTNKDYVCNQWEEK